MARGHKFDPARIARLEDPKRLEMMAPDLIWRGLGASSTSTLLDVGAGSGVFARLFAERLTAGRIFAADVSQQMLDYLRSRLNESNEKKIIPVLSTELEIPLPAESIDVAYLINVYHELSNAPALLEELRRLLVPGGTLAIVDWKKEQTAAGPPVDHRVGAEEIQHEVTAAGFGSHHWIGGLEQHQFLVARRTG